MNTSISGSKQLSPAPPLKKAPTEFKRLQSIKETVREQNSELSNYRDEILEDPYQLHKQQSASPILEKVSEAESIFTETDGGLSFENSV